MRTFGEYVLIPTVGGFQNLAAPAAGLVWIALGLFATFVSYLVLQDSEGMLEVRQALHALAELGIACNW